VFLPRGWGGLGDRPASLLTDASMSVKRLETGAGADQVVLPVSGAALVIGQRPLSPVVLAAGEACGAVADGGLSTRRARVGKFPEEIRRRRSAAGKFPDRRPRRRRG
jgi:hypothetical protein